MYEIRLQRRPPESLRRRFPTMTMQAMRAQTALFREVEEPEELDGLLQKLLSMGLVLTEVHRMSLTSRTQDVVIDEQDA